MNNEGNKATDKSIVNNSESETALRNNPDRSLRPVRIELEHSAKQKSQSEFDWH